MLHKVIMSHEISFTPLFVYELFYQFNFPVYLNLSIRLQYNEELLKTPIRFDLRAESDSHNPH